MNSIHYNKILFEGYSEAEYRKVREVMDKVVEIFKQDSKDNKVDYYSQWQNFFLKGNECELMLRFNQHQKQLVVARVRFNSRRGGLFTKVLNELEKLPSYETIVIESIGTEEMFNYVNKNGFKEDQYTPFNYNRRIVRKG